MKAFLVTVTGVKMNRDIDISDSPMAIIQKFYKDDPTAATQIFCNQKAIEDLMAGNVDETKSSFELVSLNGDGITTDFKTPLCDQPSIKEELSRIESEGDTPEFVTTVSNIVASKTLKKYL